MRIKDIEQHRPILELGGGRLSECVVVVSRIDNTRMVFSMGTSIEMTVHYEDRDPKVLEGERILINIESGKIYPIEIVNEHSSPANP